MTTAAISWTRRPDTLTVVADRSLDGITCSSAGGRHDGHSVPRSFRSFVVAKSREENELINFLPGSWVKRNFVMPWDTGRLKVLALHTPEN